MAKKSDLSYFRHILSHLQYWKQSKGRKPLILRGARQVGKTTTILDLARSYPHAILLNLEKPSDRSYFTDFDDVKSSLVLIYIKSIIKLHIY